jgi:undecaprenyl-diphosphatase
MLQNLINLDISLLNKTRALIDPSNHMVVVLVKFLADFWILFVAGLLVVLWLYWVYKKDDSYKETSLYIFYTIIFSFIVYLILNLWLPLRPRPETVSVIRPLVDHLPDNSFPSWHGIFAWAAIVACFAYLKKKCVSYTVVIISIIMLVCRVIAWIHYPWDVLVWLILWLILGCIFIKVNKNKFVADYLIAYPIKLIKYIKL